MIDASVHDPPKAAAGAVGDRAAGTTTETPADAPIIDVWSRTEPKYRRRAVVLLLVTFTLFCGLCVFAFWLREARLFDFSLASYAAPARFWGADVPNLNDYILEPISVLRTPLHAVVLGQLLAAIVAVPIVVSILYRLPCVVPFLLAVALFAHMPWMSVTLLLSAVLASVRPFRMRFHFGSALLGLLPVLLYLWLATRGTPDMLAAASPTQKTLLAAPWVLAILSAVAMMGVILLIARLVNYRPGAVAPVVAVLFATPVILFHETVGMDELAYRILERDYGPRSARFEPRQDVRPKLRELARRVVLDESLYARYLPDFVAALSGQPVSNPRQIWHLLEIEFLRNRAEAYEACKQFIADHRTSRYIPNVLYFQARVLDTRLDERTLDRLDPRRELYTDFPHVQSERVWSALLSEHADSPLAIAAGLRLGQLALRRGEVDAATKFLDQALSLGANLAARPPREDESLWAALTPAPPESTLLFEPEPHLQEARRLRDLIAQNCDDPQFGNEPLRELASLDSHRAQYAEQILRLAERVRGGRLYDNLLVRWAEAQLDPRRRTALLEALVADLPDGDGKAEAAFRLANLEIQNLGEADPARRARGVARLRELSRQHAALSWGVEATRLLEKLEPAATQRTVPQ